MTVLALLTATLAGCGGKQATQTTSGANVPHWRVWLCRPGQAVNWCNADLATTVVRADGRAEIDSVLVARRRPIDCFYVYPTVSQDQQGNADLKAGSEEQEAAVVQAARFEQVCRVFAPLYRQTTNAMGYRGNPQLAYHDVLAAWRDYLAHYNHGRGVVLIGHSQGAQMLKELIKSEIDDSGSVRSLIVSAILLGGGVVVEQGSDHGGDFEHVSACRSKTQTGCVVAYSAWARTPPKDASFQHVDKPSQQILCVNPAAPGGGTAPITPAFPWFNPAGIIPQPPEPPPTGTDWIALPGLYTARCVQAGTRAWLLVEPVGTPGDPRPVVQPYLDTRGLHAADVNIALDTLIALVRTQSRAWLANR
jgi:hypothetical protein